MSATPKSAGSRKPPAAPPGGASSATPSLLDAFPVWQDQIAAEKECPGKYEDPLGTSLPAASQPFCDAWKRTEELLHGTPTVPLVCLKPVPDADKKGKALAGSRELEGKLYAGHETFNWLLAVISYVMSAEKHIKKGDYLWELIYPRDKEGLPVKSASGKYRVKLHIMDTWRAVTIDDKIPVDLFGRALLVGSRPLQLWPLLLCKAILKVMAVYRCLEATLPHQVAAFQMLTGWPQEDLADPLGGTPLAGSALFDRLEEALGGPLRPVQDLTAMASCCLIRRSKPQRAPPRLVALTGPSAVGRSQLIARLIADFPDKFGVTVSHTSRPPMEHEVDGRDYHFTDKHKLLAEARGKKLLEAARVTVHCRSCTSSAAAAAAAPGKPLSYWYGTSLATVREVAATGKLCVMSLDMQGAQALRSNKRVDGLYLYVNTSSPLILGSRQKERLAEAASTLDKRLTWTKQQVAKSQSPGLFDVVITNTEMQEVYIKLKEAISTLSPIIRNRLRGLPSYVLDYSDLIPPNSVEKPFLKPVILAGPNVGERRKLLEMLAEEFPDVFAFPRQHTTRPTHEHLHHVGVDGDELQLLTGNNDATAPAPTTLAEQEGNEWDAAVDSNPVLGPAPVVLSKEEFDAAAGSGKFLEAHADMFKHPLVVHKHGHSMEHVKEVIKSGKLPLMELEAEGAETIKVSKGVDCLAIFLAPPSIETHEQRLKEWVTESDEEVAERQGVAAAELEAAQTSGVFDQVVVNDQLEDGYKQLKNAISRFRPDLISVDDDDEAAQAAKKAAAVNQAVPLLVLGPPGGGREQLVQQILQRYPNRFMVPKKLSDKKPIKGDKEVSTDMEYVKPDVLAKLVSQGQIVWSQQDPASGVTVAITAEALSELAAAGKMPVVDLGSVSAEQLQATRQHPAMMGAFAAYVCRKVALAAGLTAAGTAEAAITAQVEKAVTQAQEHVAAGLVQAVVDHDDPEEGFAQLQEPLSTASPWAMPPLLLPLVVAAPFGSGKRAVLQKLCKMLPNVFAVPKVVTSRPRDGVSSTVEDMEVVSPEVAHRMQVDGRFLVDQQVLGHIYGISAASVRKLQASGKLPLLDLDHVADVAKLRASGFQATYVYLQPPSLGQLQQRIRADIKSNPPLHHDPEDAANAAAAEAAEEATAAAAQPELFDVVLTHDSQEVLGAVGQLSEVLHERYPTAIPSSFVWGYGRPLWDLSSRVHGFKPLRVMLLGPAASGKSTQCAILASRFGIAHVNAGDLLYTEIAARTPLGLQAKQYMDSSKTVPDKMLLTLLLRRLGAPDCQAQGWVLDGFPHTKQQAQLLADAGHVPDKVIILEGPHNLLMDRVKYRRIDYQTGKVYHMAESGALSEPVLPIRLDGSSDADVMTRLAVRHDDSSENVANRLLLWDRQVQGLRAAYEDVLMRLPAAGSLDEITARSEAFIKLEATHSTGSCSPGSIWPIMPSWQLKELTYRVVATLKYQRQQLVQLQQLDGKLTWCNLKELNANIACMLLAHNPTCLPVSKCCKRLDSNSIRKQQLLLIDSPEPFRLLTCLSMGPQHTAVPPPPASKKVFVLAGPCGAGRTTLAHQLLQDFGDKLVPVPLLTNRLPHPSEVANNRTSKPSAPSTTFSHAAASSKGGSIAGSDCSTSLDGAPFAAGTTGGVQPVYSGSKLLQFVPEQQFSILHRSEQLVGLQQYLGHGYGVSIATLEAATAEGKAVLIVAPLAVAGALRQDLLDTQVTCFYITADTASLDCRLRASDTLEEERLQQLLQDAVNQEQLLQQLLQQQDDEVRAEQARQQVAATVNTTAAQLATVPSTPSSASRMAKEGTAKALQQLAALQQQQSQQDVSNITPQPAAWLQCMSNRQGQLQACYSVVKGAVAKHWPVVEQRLPGLLVMQRHASDAVAKHASSRLNSAKSGGDCQPSLNDAADIAATSGACLDADTFSLSQTLLRLKAITASSSMLHIARGKHLLQLQCSPQLLHCITLLAAEDFTIDEAAKLLPATYELHVATQEGRHDLLQADSRQLLFRYTLKPTDACHASIAFNTSSTALQACTQLMLVDNSSREVTTNVLNQLTQLQLSVTDKGYTLLALAQPCADIPAGSWSVSISSSRPLQPMQELPVQRQVLFEGVYVQNAGAVVARVIINASNPVQLAMLSQLYMPASAVDSKPEPPPIVRASSSNSHKYLPLAYSLQLFDTSGAKEVIWEASYKLVAEVTSAAGSNGRSFFPNLQLQPGKYLVVVQLQPDVSQQWVDKSTGTTEPAPSWQLLLLPSADEKSCPITRDDAYERHFKSTIDDWQQQAAQLAAASIGGSRPNSRDTSSASASARLVSAAAKDRPKQAQQALERHLTAEQQLAAAAPGLTTLSIPGGAIGGQPVAAGHATARKALQAGAKPKTPPQASDRNGFDGSVVAGGAGASSGAALFDVNVPGSVQVSPRVASSSSGAVSTVAANQLNVPPAAVRLVKGGELQIMPAQQLKHVQAAKRQAGTTAGSTCPPAQESLISSSLLGSSQLTQRLQQLQMLTERQAPQLAGMPKDGQPVIGALQAQEATGFFNWRCSRACEQQAVASHKAQLQNYLAGPAPDVSGAVPPAPATAARKADKASARS